MNFIKKEDLIPLLEHHGYVLHEKEVPDDMYKLFITNMEAQLREAIRVALVSADNHNRRELQEEDIQSILNQLRIFPRKK